MQTILNIITKFVSFIRILLFLTFNSSKNKNYLIFSPLRVIPSSDSISSEPLLRHTNSKFKSDSVHIFARPVHKLQLTHQRTRALIGQALLTWTSSLPKQPLRADLSQACLKQISECVNTTKSNLSQVQVQV